MHTQSGDHPYLPWPIHFPAVNVPFFDIQAYKNVNLDVAPSENPLGSDLPLNDIATLRFFFNMGVQQSRVVLLNHHLSQNQNSANAGPGANATAPPAPLVAPAGAAVANPGQTTIPGQNPPPIRVSQFFLIFLFFGNWFQIPPNSNAAVVGTQNLTNEQLSALANLLPQNSLLR